MSKSFYVPKLALIKIQKTKPNIFQLWQNEKEMKTPNLQCL